MTGDGSRSVRARVDAAIADLSELHSNDPAARPAIHAIELTRLTLESFWPRRDEQRER